MILPHLNIAASGVLLLSIDLLAGREDFQACPEFFQGAPIKHFFRLQPGVES